MNISNVYEAMELPAGARVDQRVPKKLLVANGAPTAADKRRINEGIEEIYWLASLKPTTIGVPEYHDEVREYLEVAVLSLVLRSGAKVERLVQLVHRAVPYPVWLFLSHDDRITLSLAHKRRSQSQASEVVLDGEIVTVELKKNSTEAEQLFMNALSLAKQRRTNMFDLYQGWIETLLAWKAFHLTGIFAQATTIEHAAARSHALVEYDRLSSQIMALRSQAMRESQVNRRVELNLKIKRLEAQLDDARSKL